MFMKNTFFVISGVLIVAQQIILALSTWIIAQAGIAVSENNLSTTTLSLVGFFICALGAYIISAFSEYFMVRAENTIWKNYIDKSADYFSDREELSAEKNRATLSTWLSSEAEATIYGATRFYLGFLSTALNVLFTSGVFFLTLGHLIGGAILTSLLLSIFCVVITRDTINNLATKSQNKKLESLIMVSSLLTNGSHGTTAMYREYKNSFHLKLEEYFLTTVSYTKLEQLIACGPTVFSVGIILTAIVTSNANTALQVGALVAVLPRSLQLLGNVHSLGVYLSQLFMLKKKVSNLESYASNMVAQFFEGQVNRSSVTIYRHSDGTNVAIDDFTSLGSTEITPLGRYTIYGPNGAGKSSLLQAIKSKLVDAVMLTPTTNFGMTEKNLSTGQLQKLQMENIFKINTQVILLDEWDANLDSTNVAILDKHIEAISKSKLVIEIRHRS